MTSKVKVGLFTAVSLVVANMIGTGVFTSLGFQVVYLQSVFTLLMLWVVGGIIALCGALSYGELGAALPRSGGEYHLLSRIYHPSLGFLAGWVSATLGFAAPTALAAMALGSYTHAVYPEVSPTHLAAIVVILISFVHAYSVRIGSYFQDFFTTLKVLLILIFIAAALFIENHQAISVIPEWQDMDLITSPAFAVSLIFVSYAYTGWNAAVYIIDEVKEPSRNLPRALFVGTLLVLFLYVLLNFVFLYSVPMNDLAGQIEVGFLSSTRIFGVAEGKLMALVIALLLVSTVSAMVFVGPRISMAMGEDFKTLRFLGIKSNKGIPVNAILFQAGVTLLFIYTSTFEQVLIYAGFSLTMITTLTVAGVFVLRFKKPQLPRPYKTWGYPFTSALYLFLSLWILTYVMIDKTLESLIGIGISLFGLIFYFIERKMYRKREQRKAVKT